MQFHSHGSWGPPKVPLGLPFPQNFSSGAAEADFLFSCCGKPHPAWFQLELAGFQVLAGFCGTGLGLLLEPPPLPPTPFEQAAQLVKCKGKQLHNLTKPNMHNDPPLPFPATRLGRLWVTTPCRLGNSGSHCPQVDISRLSNIS